MNEIASIGVTRRKGMDIVDGWLACVQSHFPLKLLSSLAYSMTRLLHIQTEKQVVMVR